MALTTPIVSVCIPAYNCEKYIGETIVCLVSQTYPHMEILVVNDGSTDDTLKVLLAVPDKRIRIISTENGGAARARNTAYKNSTGRYIMFFDADDYIKPDFIEQQVKHLPDGNHAVVLADWGRFYDDDLATFKRERSPDKAMTFKQWITVYWHQCNPMTNPGRAIIPRTLIDEAGLWNEDLSLNDDLEFFTRVFLKAGLIIFNKEACLYYRSGVQGLSGKKSPKAYRSLYNSIFLSMRSVLEKHDADQAILQACANMWQSFIYEVYPGQQELIKNAQQQMKQLPRPNLEFKAGRFTKCLVKIAGWRAAKKIKSKLK